MTETIRWLLRQDMPAMLAIERVSFEFPWSEQDFLETLWVRGVIGNVLTSSEQPGSDIRAFMIYQLKQGGIELLRLAVDPHFCREGYGRRMVGKLTSKLSAVRRTWIAANVRASNLDAQLFFAAHGFRCIAIVQDETDEDLYRFRYDLPADDLDDAELVDRAIRARGRRA